ncbi:hypothetical protein ACLOJK_004660 [Asimina triloba]
MEGKLGFLYGDVTADNERITCERRFFGGFLSKPENIKKGTQTHTDKDADTSRAFLPPSLPPMQSNLASFPLPEPPSNLSSSSSSSCSSEMVAGSKNFMKRSNSMENESTLKGWISNRGGYASMAPDPCVSCTTFNILAPIYKRLDEEEFWLGNQELVDMYETRLGEIGYINFKLARTNNRGDGIPLISSLVCNLSRESYQDFEIRGLLTAIHKDYFRVLNYRELLFNDFGDRVAQLLHVESVVPFWQSRNSNIRQEILIVNTHLLFPHYSHLSIVRLRQVYKILQYVESYQKEKKLNPMPIILCGDWNGSKRGHWVSHRNHHGNICGVDFIWLLNPNKSRKLLKMSWNEAVFGIIKYLLRQASPAEKDAFAFLKGGGHGDYVTYSGFCQALHQLGLTGHPDRLSVEETQDLWAEADRDGNGVVDYEEFQHGIWNPTRLKQPEENYAEERLDAHKSMERLAIGFDVKNAVLFPPEVEKGMWPDNYSLSDHAPLTVIFSPRRMPCSQPLC